MQFTNETLARDFKNDSLRQSYLLLSVDTIHLNEIAKWFATHFKIADVFWLSTKDDAKSITVEQTLDFCNKVQYASVGNKKLMIVTDVALMTIQAQNKILKSLEDVRDDTVFLLLASNPERVLATIKSRCVIINIPTLLDGSLYNKQLIEQNKDSAKIFEYAEQLIKCKALDEALLYIPLLSAKENFEVTMIALHKIIKDALHDKSLPVKKAYGLLKVLSDINRNVMANCNYSNAFDLLVIELFH
ncbi:MAG: hypothetical protein FWE45_01020 [Firmicutes bacterium]|nr:hypothetical protein [Bacillota bacterium]